ncbi:hypothetical protein V6N13_003322 [Hibiscus sabdariffa]
MLDPVVAMSELHYKLRSNSLANSALDGDAAHVASLWHALRRELQKMIQKLPNEILSVLLKLSNAVGKLEILAAKKSLLAWKKRKNLTLGEIILLSQSSRDGQNACTIAMLDNLNISLPSETITAVLHGILLRLSYNSRLITFILIVD